MMKKVIIPILTIIIILSVGTISYHYLEKWTYLDSLFYSATALSTGTSAGVIPKTDLGKVFTVFYIFGSVGTVLFELTQIGQPQLEQHLSKGIDTLKDKIKNNGGTKNEKSVR